MFDQEGDAMSVYSQSSRMPSLVMEPGQSMQDYYKALQMQAAELNAANAQRVGGQRQRRNSGSSVMSDTERLYGWSGSRGGIANNETGPKYRIDSQGHLILADEIKKKKQDQATPDSSASATPLQANSNVATVLGANNTAAAATPSKPALRSARSDSGKPMYRPAFAPSAVLPPSSDEEVDEDDRVIQHDLPTTRPLKARPSLKQKLGSLVARVGSVRRGGGLASPPINATSPSNTKSGEASTSPPKDYLSVKRATTSAAAYGRKNRPDLTRKGSSLANDASAEEEDVESKVLPVDTSAAPVHVVLTEADENTPPPSSTPTGVTKDNSGDDKAYLSADGGAFTGGMVGLARKLSRRATTGNRHRARSVPRNLREEREKQADLLQDKEAAEQMLKDLAKIPLYKPPRSAHVKNAKPLSSFPPRAPLKVPEHGSLANAPRYRRPLNDVDGPRGRSDVERANTTGGAGRSKHNHGRGRSGSTPSTFSSFSSNSGLPLLSGSSKLPSTIKEGSQDDDDVPPVPPLPELTKDAPMDGTSPPGDGATTNWTVFKKESSTTLNKA